MDLERIKIILGIDDDDDTKDALLTILLENAMNALCVYLGVDTLPNSLKYIAQELTVSRYNKIGAEGISTEKIGELSTTYSVNDLGRYKDILKMYKDNNGLSGKKVKFI